jgi:hypothetical protein
MRHRFTGQRPHVGGLLPQNTFGRLVATFESSSPIPLRGGKNTGRHIYLALKVPDGQEASGVFECAVNIRSDEDTSVRFAERIEDSPSAVDPGFSNQVGLSYDSTGGDGVDHMELTNDDFAEIENDDLYKQISDLTQNCNLVEVYGVTYSGGDGIHDVHMNHGTDPSDPHARDDHDGKDGAIAFHFTVTSGGESKKYAHWIFIRFETQTLAASE